MATLAVFVVLAMLVCSGELGRPKLDRWSQMTPEEQLADAQAKFALFKAKYNKSYPDLLEESKRFQIFTKALGEISRLNFLEQGTAEYAVNYFADLTDGEFAEYTNLVPENLDSLQALPQVAYAAPKNVQIPSEFDWRSKNAVTPVKNQGRCGSCWAFSTVAQIEAAYASKHGNQKTFSEQQLVDCDRQSSGCNGGWPASAIQSIIDKGGLNEAGSYPYEGRQRSCRYSASSGGATVSSSKQLRSSDENGMAEYIATTSPTINAINARMLQYYRGGIISAPNYRCNRGRNAVNHAVTFVGFGRDSSKRLNFWTGKNSWGSDWGENGFFRIERGSNNCGIANFIYAAEVN